MTAIRLLHGDDGLAYQELRLLSLQSNPEAFLTKYQVESGRNETRFQHELESFFSPPVFGYYGYWLTSSRHQDELIGYTLLAGSSMPKQKHVAWLYNLYIHPRFRRSGVAHQLMEFITYTAKHKAEPGIESLYLTCLARNTAAYRFYKGLGFKRCGVRRRSVKWKDQYEDEVELTKQLT